MEAGAAVARRSQDAAAAVPPREVQADAHRLQPLAAHPAADASAGGLGGDHAGRARVGRAPHSRAHSRPPVPLRPDRGHRPRRGSRPADHHASHLWPGCRRRSAQRVLRIAEQGRRSRRRHVRASRARAPLRRLGRPRRGHPVTSRGSPHDAAPSLSRAGPDHSRRAVTPPVPTRVWGPMAESETFAHLEHLRATGEAQSRREGGALVYEINAPEPTG